MRMRLNLALVMLTAALTPAPVWAAAHADVDMGLVGFNAMKLSPAQQRGVYQGVGKVTEATPPEHYLIHVGGTVPESIKLQPLPAAATQQVPALKNDDYVKFDEGEPATGQAAGPHHRRGDEPLPRHSGAAIRLMTCRSSVQSERSQPSSRNDDVR